MKKIKSNKLVLSLRLVMLSLAVTLVSHVGLAVLRPSTATAAVNTTINFQARLLTAAGATVSDGDYNVEFKLYNAASSSGSSQGSCSGDAACVWTETRITSNKVRVVNGYLTVNLGSVTSFGSINWDQELWMTMRVGGTGTVSWDNEMTPRLKLTAVPYAFKANQLANTNGANRSTLDWATQTGSNAILLPNASGTICLQSSSACGFLTGSATDYIQNQNSTSQTANFRINGTGRADVALQAPLFDTASAGALAIGTTNATSISLQQNTTLASGKTLAIQGNTTIQPSSDGVAFNIRSSTTTNIFTVNTSNARVGIGNGTPSYSLDVTGDINSTTALRVAGTTVCTSTGCTPASGSANYIQNQSGSTQTANFKIQGSGISTNTATIVGVVNQDNDLFQFQSSAGTPVAGIRPTGAIYSAAVSDPVTDVPANARLFVQPVANTSTAIIARASSGGAPTGDILQLQNAAGTTNHFTVGAAGATTVTSSSATAFVVQNTSNVATFTVNNSTARVAIGAITPSYPLDVVGDINSSTGLRVAGTTVCTSTGCTPAAGSANYIQNQNTVSQTANFRISGTGRADVALQAPIFDTAAAGALSLGTTNATSISLLQSTTIASNKTFTANGTTLFKPATDAAGAFQIQASGSSTPILSVDTSTSRVGIGTNAPTRALDVAVSDASNSALPLIVRQASTGDSGIEIKNTAQSYYVGVDTSDSNKFKITSSSASGTATMGVDTVGALTDSGDSNFMNAMQVTAGSTGVLTTLYANVGTTLGTAPNNQGQMAIYSNSGGVPGTLLGSSTSSTLATGWNAFSLSSPVNVTSGTVYWISYNTNGTASNQNNLRYDATGGTVRYTGQTFGTWPGTFPAGTSSPFKFSMYGIIQASAGSDSFANNLFQLTTNGQATFKNNSNSTTAFQVQNAASSGLFTIDTTSSIVQIGAATTDATAVELVLDSYNQATDPTGIVGAMYYNTNTGNFRCYTATKWNNCGGLMLSSTNSVTINSGCTNACAPVATATSVWVPGFCTVGRVIHLYASGVYSNASGLVALGLYIGTSTTKASNTQLGGTINSATPNGATAYGWEFDGYIICNSTTSVLVHGATSYLTDPNGGNTADSKIYSTTTTTITDTAQNLYLFPSFSVGAGNSITANQFIIETM